MSVMRAIISESRAIWGHCERCISRYSEIGWILSVALAVISKLGAF
jgi:hypothetical protein